MDKQDEILKEIHALKKTVEKNERFMAWCMGEGEFASEKSINDRFGEVEKNTQFRKRAEPELDNIQKNTEFRQTVKNAPRKAKLWVWLFAGIATISSAAVAAFNYIKNTLN